MSDIVARIHFWARPIEAWFPEAPRSAGFICNPRVPLPSRLDG